MVGSMNEKKKSKSGTKMTAAEFALTAKQVFEELVKQGFTTEQAFQLTRDVVQAMCR